MYATSCFVQIKKQKTKPKSHVCMCTLAILHKDFQFSNKLLTSIRMTYIQNFIKLFLGRYVILFNVKNIKNIHNCSFVKF